MTAGRRLVDAWIERSNRVISAEERDVVALIIYFNGVMYIQLDNCLTTFLVLISLIKCATNFLCVFDGKRISSSGTQMNQGLNRLRILIH